MKKLSLILLLLLLLIPYSTLVYADNPPSKTASTADELLELFAEYQYTGGHITLTADITLTSAKERTYSNKSKQPIVIETNTHSIRINSAIHFYGMFQFIGTGIEQAVITSYDALTFTGCSITATGDLDQGGTAIVSYSNVLLQNTEVYAHGSRSTAIQTDQLVLFSSSIESNGTDSQGMAMDNPAASLKMWCSTIKAFGVGARSIIIPELAKTSCWQTSIEPPVSSIINIDVQPEEFWNQQTLYRHADDPSPIPNQFSCLLYPDAAPYYVQSYEISFQVTWDSPLPVVQTPGTYELTGTITECNDYPALIGQPYYLNLSIGAGLIPKLRPSIKHFSQDSNSFQLTFSLPVTRITSNTKLWITEEDTIDWKEIPGSASGLFSISETNGILRDTSYLLVVQASHDPLLDGNSPIYSLRIEKNNLVTFIENTSPHDIPLPSNPAPISSASSWEELIRWVSQANRTETTIQITQDLIVDRNIRIEPYDYIDEQSNILPIYMDMGNHTITINEGGSLYLNVTQLRGAGTNAPLIHVNNKGHLNLGPLSSRKNQPAPMLVQAYGNESLGGTALFLEENSRFTTSSPSITLSASGSDATALVIQNQKTYYLPTGLRIETLGANSTAVSASGQLYVLYCSLTALGTNALAVSAPAITLNTSYVYPECTSARQETCYFLAFNESIYDIPPLLQTTTDLKNFTSSTIPITVGLDKQNSITKTISISCEWDESAINYGKAGCYPLTGRLKTTNSLSIADLPETVTVTVGIQKAGSVDISLIRPVPPISFPSLEGNPMVYGIRIDTLYSYNENNSTLMISDANAGNWIDASTQYTVFYEDNHIYLSGLEPEKEYLLQLKSTGSNDIPLSLPSGISEIQKIILHADNTITSIGWNGNADGGDQTEPVQPPYEQPVIIDPGKEETNDDEREAPDTSENPSSTQESITPDADSDISTDLTPISKDSKTETLAPGRSDLKTQDANNTHTDSNIANQSKHDQTKEKHSKSNASAKSENTTTDNLSSCTNSPPANNLDETPRWDPSKDNSQPLYEKITENTSQLSGFRLKKLMQTSTDVITFAWNDMLLDLPIAYLSGLNLQNTSIFSVTLQRKGDTSFTIELKLDQEPLTHFADSKFRITQQKPSDNLQLFLGSTAINTKLSVSQHYITFLVNQTGTYTIKQINNTSLAAAPSEPASKDKFTYHMLTINSILFVSLLFLYIRKHIRRDHV